MLARLPADLRHFPTNLVYFAGLVYGLMLSMGSTLVPLYVLDLGHGAAQVGIVVSVQGLLQVLLQFAGGVFSDRFGERVVIATSFASYAAGIAAIVALPSFAVLIVAQLLIGVSRSIYWIAGQSYVTRSYPSNSGLVLGRILSFESVGSAVGGLIAGVQVAYMGFTAAFATCALLGALGLFAVLLVPDLPRHASVRTLRDSLAPVPKLMRSKPIFLAGIIAFAASLTSAMIYSLYTVFYVEVGFGQAFIGATRSLHSIGIVVVAFGFGAIMARSAVAPLACIGLLATAALTAGTIIAGGDAWPAALAILAIGGTFGILRALYPALAARASVPEQRGVALSVAALYWGLGQLFVPVTFGYLGELLGTRAALWIAAAVLAAFAVFVPWLYRRWMPKN